MKKRNPISVFLLGFVTLGIYSWYWAVKTKGEMNKLGEAIPTAWIWIIPFVGSIWWYWKYSQGVEHITGEKLSWVMALVVLFLLGNIGQAIVQDFFNKTEPSVAVNPSPTISNAQTTPTQPIFQPINNVPVMPHPGVPNQDSTTNTTPPVVS